MELKGSRTEANLMAAYAGEAQARDKYTCYAAKAKEDGYEQISEIFKETAENERAHADIWFKLIHDGAVPATAEALRDAAADEHFEWAQMYADFAKTAKEEGFERIAFLFEKVAEIEKFHESRFLRLMENVKDKKVFTKDGDCIWICRNCGHICIGKAAPGICPVCSKPQSYFEIKAANY